ncbi:MAG: enoyl-CoA hydratase/isomerase family protein [Gammaproteobacteria bacterium]|nr:enoyl-CoA hydratase/isomerase family protein [Gammaproteobacteria bacterium]
MVTESEHLLVDCNHGIATLTFNRLQQHNAFDVNLIKQLQKTLDEFALDPSIRVIKINAKGKYFCAGGDLKWFKNATTLTDAENQEDAALLARLLQTLNTFPKPTVAVIQGSAFGGGVGLIACCDIAIAAHSASFALSEVKLGLVPATIAPHVLRAIGARQLRHFALTAEAFTSEEAYHIGLVHSVVNDSLLVATADTIIAQLLNNGPIAMATTKKLIQDLSITPAGELEKTAQLLAQIRVSSEAQEGLSAFFEKRAPSWS